MKFFLLSENSDTLVGMRLAGIDGVCVQSQADANSALMQAVQEESIGMILLTPQVASFCKDVMEEYSKKVRPLLVTIPDPKSDGMDSTIAKYISEAIGIPL